MKQKSNQLFSIKDILSAENLIGSKSPVLSLLELSRRWTDLVGETIAGHATPTQLKAGQLTLQAPNAAWAQELQMLSPEILEKLSQQCPHLKIKRVRIVAG